MGSFGMLNAPVIVARDGFGDIILLNDSKIVLDTATITTCVPGGGSYPTASPSTAPDVWSTVYTTEYIQVCPTATPCPKGTTTETFTITETCTGSKSDYTPPALPPNFTTVAQICEVCEGKPTLTVTCPLATATSTGNGASNGGSNAGSNGASNAASNGAAATGPAGSVATAPASGAQSGGSSGAPASGSSANGAGSGAGAPAAAPASESCPGCPATGDVAQGGSASGVSGSDNQTSVAGSNPAATSMQYVQAAMASTGRPEIFGALLVAAFTVSAWFL